MVNDVISDLLARIRNAQMVKSEKVEVLSTKMTRRVSQVMLDNGYIDGMKEKGSGIDQKLQLVLKYDSDMKPVIDGLKRVSKPSLRVYSSANDMPSVRNGLGIAIVSTSKGVITGSQARKARLGGEVLCHLW